MAWQFFTRQEFEDLVRQNQVQYLIWDNGMAQCRYTDEEIDALGALGYSTDTIELTQDNYFDMDAVIGAEDVMLAFLNDSVAVAGIAGEVVSLLGFKMIKLIFVGRTEKIDSLQSAMLGELPSLQRAMFRSDNSLSCAVPVMSLNNVFSRSIVKPLFSTYTIKTSSVGSTKGMKRGLIKSKLGSSATGKIIAQIDSLNAYNRAETGYSQGFCEHLVKAGLKPDEDRIVKELAKSMFGDEGDDNGSNGMAELNPFG